MWPFLSQFCTDAAYSMWDSFYDVLLIYKLQSQKSFNYILMKFSLEKYVGQLLFIKLGACSSYKFSKRSFFQCFLRIIVFVDNVLVDK